MLSEAGPQLHVKEQEKSHNLSFGKMSLRDKEGRMLEVVVIVLAVIAILLCTGFLGYIAMGG